MSALEKHGYSLENARKFAWSSVSGALHPERRAHLDNYVVGPDVLDAGCGGGAFVDYLSNKFTVTGVDLYDEFLAVAREQGFRGTFVRGDVCELPFPDKSFDTVYCFDVLEHVNDEVAIAELARVARKRIILAVPREDDVMGPYSLTFFHYHDKTHLRNYTEDSLADLAARVAPLPNVRVFPELPVPTAALVGALMTLDAHAARRDLEAELELPAPPDPPAPPVWDRVVPPTLPVRGVRSHVKAWAMRQPQVEEAFETAYRDAYEAVYQEFQEAYQSAYAALDAAHRDVQRRFFEERLNPFLTRLLDRATYKTVYTGLVAVIDLA